MNFSDEVKFTSNSFGEHWTYRRTSKGLHSTLRRDLWYFKGKFSRVRVLSRVEYKMMQGCVKNILLVERKRGPGDFYTKLCRSFRNWSLEEVKRLVGMAEFSWIRPRIFYWSILKWFRLFTKQAFRPLDMSWRIKLKNKSWLYLKAIFKKYRYRWLIVSALCVNLGILRRQFQCILITRFNTFWIYGAIIMLIITPGSISMRF